MPFEAIAIRASKSLNIHEVALAASFVESLDESSGIDLVDPAYLEHNRIFLRVRNQSETFGTDDQFTAHLGDVRLMGLPVQVVDTAPSAEAASSAILVDVTSPWSPPASPKAALLSATERRTARGSRWAGSTSRPSPKPLTRGAGRSPRPLYRLDFREGSYGEACPWPDHPVCREPPAADHRPRDPGHRRGFRRGVKWPLRASAWGPRVPPRSRFRPRRQKLIGLCSTAFERKPPLADSETAHLDKKRRDGPFRIPHRPIDCMQDIGCAVTSLPASELVIVR